VHCIEALRQGGRRVGSILVLALAACTSPMSPNRAPVSTATPTPSQAPAPAPAPAEAARSGGVATPPGQSRSAPSAGAATAPAASAGVAAGHRARNWDDFRQQAAQRLVAANRAGTYLGAVPEPLLAIPVLEIELNGDGSVRRIQVVRQPSRARDTVQLAIDAVHRAAPFGDVSHLPRPWKFSEVFLFGDDRRFKPRTLDL